VHRLADSVMASAVPGKDPSELIMKLFREVYDREAASVPVLRSVSNTLIARGIARDQKAITAFLTAPRLASRSLETEVAATWAAAARAASPSNTVFLTLPTVVRDVATVPVMSGFALLLAFWSMTIGAMLFDVRARRRAAAPLPVPESAGLVAGVRRRAAEKARSIRGIPLVARRALAASGQRAGRWSGMARAALPIPLRGEGGYRRQAALSRV
jgi:hypothetical protein